ncbi:DNA_pol_B_2 domain-containing protein [Trichonephila clavipes]|nr:DNA_pol_B_2 domain-containing protein [Trichonephila clavipes]
MKYCDSDVDILRRGCLEMRKLFLKIADIDPFRYVTLAGVCMAIYRSKFLKEGTIAIDEDIKQDVYKRETVKCKHKNKVGKPKSAVEKKKCKECYEIRNKECNHTDEERSFIGTWTTTEVKLAIQKGYEILNVYEVWNFNSKSKDLFRDYVKMFLKIKLETDDKWNFKTEEEYRRYVKEKLDIELGKIEKNPRSRFISKICLNSLWAAFTTSSARIRLYDIMDKLGDKVLYSDTDSIMYIDDGTNTKETGCMLGEWTDELEKDQYIQHWISPASKDYAYRLNNGKVKDEVKGFKMSYESETKLNFEERMKIITGETEIRLMVDNDESEAVTVDLATNLSSRSAVTLGRGLPSRR